MNILTKQESLIGHTAQKTGGWIQPSGTLTARNKKLPPVRGKTAGFNRSCAK